VTTHTQLVGSGLQPLIDEIKAAGADPGDLRALVWQATWARGYEDVISPVPVLRQKKEGFVILTRSFDRDRYAVIIDTAQALWALVVTGVAPPVGSRVRIVPASFAGQFRWEVTVLEALGLGLSIRFGPKLDETELWANSLRGALARIGNAEIQRRKAIVVERRWLVTVEPVPPLRQQIHDLEEHLRQRVDRETAATPEERLAYERGDEKQRKATVHLCKTRRLTRYTEELARFKDSIPDLTAVYNERLAANAEAQATVARLEDSASESRGLTARLAIVEQQLDVVSSAGLLVGADLRLLDGLDSARFAELSATVELLHDLIPRRATKRAGV
jgi:hypothetical protein